jgi:hypothetical protein
MSLDGETTKTKVVDPEKLWNFVVDGVFIGTHLCMENLHLNFSHLKFELFKQPQMEKQPKQKLYISKSDATLKLTTFLFETIYAWKIYICNSNISNNLGWRKD